MPGGSPYRLKVMTKGWSYWHGTSTFWSSTRSRIKHDHFLARRDDRRQWGTSQSPGPLVEMSREEAEKYEGFFDISNPKKEA